MRGRVPALVVLGREKERREVKKKPRKRRTILNFNNDAMHTKQVALLSRYFLKYGTRRKVSGGGRGCTEGVSHATTSFTGGGGGLLDEDVRSVDQVCHGMI